MLDGLITEVVVAVIFATAGYFYVSIKTGIQRYLLERRYPVAGEFISTYEDEDAQGNRLLIKAPVVLKQKGLKVTGITFFGDKRWLIDCDYDPKGFLHGIYYAESTRDGGLGNIFLEVSLNGDMDGIWSGYDSANKKLSHGRYTFKRTLDCEIRPMRPNEATRVVSIAEKQLGESYLKETDLLVEGSSLCLVAVRKDQSIVGFVTGRTVSREDLYAQFPKLGGVKSRSMDIANTIGYVGSVACDEEHKGRGVGDRLLAACIEKLRQDGAEYFVMTGWKDGERVNIGSLAVRHNFEPLEEITDYWREASEREGYYCPSCGVPPCRCAAVVFARYSA